MPTLHYILTLARTCAVALVYVCAWMCLCAGMSTSAWATTLTSTRDLQSASNTINDVSLANNASYATPATIPLIAAATPAAGTTITRIEVYSGTILIASNSNSANSSALNTTWITLKPGTQTLTARAIDSNGGISTASVTITVTGAANETITFIHNDLAGSPMAATDINGAIVWKEDYTPYGERKQNEAAASNQHQWFGGKVQDSETGLSYFGARYYDPVVGRFMGVDAVGFNPGNLQSFNRYAYANNNPYRFVDPSGNAPVDWIHGGLTAFSFCPSICGSAFSAIDGAVYTAQGDSTGAAISFGAAAIGIVSDAGVAKVAAMAAKEGAAALKAGSEVTAIGREATTFYHYTDAAGAAAIAESGIIKANSAGKVFVTDQKLSAEVAQNRIFLGNTEKGSHVVEINAKGGLPVSAGKNSNELIHQGSIRNGRQGDLTVKSNDF